MTVVDSLKAAIQTLVDSPTDEGAWRFLYREMRPFILGIVYRRLKNIGSAEDATQEVLLHILRARPFNKVREEGAFRAYVWRMALNVANTHLRRAIRQHKGEHQLAELRTVQDDLVGQVSEEQDRMLMEEALHLVMDELEPKDRAFLELLLGGSKLGEAGEKLGMSYSAAGVRFHRLKQKLRKLLTDNDNFVLR